MASWLDSYVPEATGAPRQVEPSPKPEKRHRASGAEEKKIRAAFEHACCITCGMRPVERHHIVPRSQGGDDVIENLAPLCHQHHMILEGHSPGWERTAAMVRKYVWDDHGRRNYVWEKLGERFNRRYPPLPNTDPQFQSDFRTIYGLDQVEGHSRSEFEPPGDSALYPSQRP